MILNKGSNNILKSKKISGICSWL